MEIRKYDELVAAYIKASNKHKAAQEHHQAMVRSIQFAREAERQAERDERVAWAQLMDHVHDDIEARREQLT